MTPQDALRRAILNDEFPDDSDTDRLFVPSGEDALKLNRNIALSAWMSQVSKSDINAGSATWQADKDALAQGFFKIPTAKDVTDESIHDLIKSHIQTADNSTEMALTAALSGRPLPETLAELNSLTGVSKTRGIRDMYTQDASRIYGNVTAKIAPYRMLIDDVSGALGKEMKSAMPTTDAFQKAAEAIIQAPAEDRGLIIQAIGATGGATAEERSSYLSKIAARMGRITETIGSSIESNAGTFGSVLDAFPSGLAGKTDEVAGIMGAEAKAREFSLLTQQIRSAAADLIDPVKGNGWLEKTGLAVAEMIPQTAITVANPYVGFSANLAYFRDTIGADLLAQNPDMTSAQADEVAVLTAPLNAAVETVTALIPWGRVRLPGVQKWIMAQTASIGGAARNLGIRAATGTAAEIGEEWAQSYLPLKAQELMGKLKEDMPEVDWERNMPKFGDIAAEVWGPALVMSLVGAGAASISDINNGRTLASDLDLMVATGIKPELAEKIKTASDAGNWSQVDGLFREDFTTPTDKKATEEERTQATTRLTERVRAMTAAEKVNWDSPDYTVSVTRGASGWRVETGDGQTIPVDSAEAARRIAVDLRQVGSQQEADALVGIIDNYHAKEGKAETVLTGEEVLGSDVAVKGFRDGNERILDANALETIRKEAENIGIETDTQDIFAHINGSNIVFANKIGKDAKEIIKILNLYQSQKGGQPQVVTFLHESIESNFALGLKTGAINEDEVRQAFAALAPALDPGRVRKGHDLERKLYENVRTLAAGGGDATMLRETFSELAVRDAFARDRSNKTAGSVGSISRAIEAAVMGAKTQEEATFLVRFRAMLKAFSTYLKGVLRTVGEIKRGREKGLIGEEWDAFVDKVTGLDETKLLEIQAAEQAVKDVQAAGNMAFSLGRAVPADASNVTEMPDGAQLVGPTSFSLQAYHGTPHKVDKFTTAKIGTGEGAQAYGWGLYFAENKAVAAQYAHDLGNAHAGRKLQLEAAHRASTKDAADIRAWLDGSKPWPQNTRGEPVSREFLEKRLREYEEDAILTKKAADKIGSNLYTVELLPDEADFLDWDAPLSEQSEKVQQIVRAEMQRIGGAASTGERVYRELMFHFRTNGRGGDSPVVMRVNEGAKAVSEHLASLGIPGIRYLDGQSRDGGSGTSNYVIFDENLVKILEENGKPVSGASFSLAPKDTEYLAAVESGDMAKAQAMVDEAARAAGYGEKLKHGSRSSGFQTFDPGRNREEAFSNGKKPWFFAENEGTARTYGPNIADYRLKLDRPLEIHEVVGRDSDGEYQREAFMREDAYQALPEDIRELLEEAKDGDADTDSLVKEMLASGVAVGSYAKAFKKWGSSDNNGMIAYDTLDTMGPGDRDNIHIVFDPSQIKSADPVTRDESGQVIPLSQRFNAETPDIRFSISAVTPAQDSEYLAAVEAGDMAKAQAMVDEAAKKAGLEVSNDGYWRAGEDQTPDNSYLTDSPETAEQYATSKQTIRRIAYKKGKSLDLWAVGGKSLLEKVTGIKADSPYTFTELNKQSVRDAVWAKGYDSIEFEDMNNDGGEHWAVLVKNGNQIKSADPVTRDKSGQVIPLSQRFNAESSDIRFSISPITNLEEVQEAIYQRMTQRPEEALRVWSNALKKIQKLIQRNRDGGWTWAGDRIRPISDKRTVKSLDKEQAMREATRESELIDEGLAALTPETMLAYSEGVGTLEDDPLIAKMLHDNGKLMSKSTAEREGKGIKDLYDDAPWIPPSWYSGGTTITTVIVSRADGSTESYDSRKVPDEVKAEISDGTATAVIKKHRTPATGGIMPDVMANNLGFDTASEMWAALESSIKSHRSAKEGYLKAEKAVRDVEKAAKEQAKEEAQAWRDEAEAMQAEDWNPREAMIRDLVAYEAILSTMPKEIRGQLSGGFVALARKGSEAGRGKVIKKKVEKMAKLLERHFKKKLFEKIESQFEKYGSEVGKAGQQESKLTTETSGDVDFARRFSNMPVTLPADSTEKSQDAVIGDLEKVIEESEDQDSVEAARDTLAIANLFYDMAKMDASELESAALWLDSTIAGGLEARKAIKEARKAYLDERRGRAKKDVLKGSPSSLVEAENAKAEIHSSGWKQFVSDVKGYVDSVIWTAAQQLEIIFGKKSQLTEEFHGRLVRAANQETDIKIEFEARRKIASEAIFGTGSTISQAGKMGKLQQSRKSGVIVELDAKTKTEKIESEIVESILNGEAEASEFGIDTMTMEALADQWADNQALPGNRRKKWLTWEKIESAGRPVEIEMSEADGIQYLLQSQQKQSREQMERDGWGKASFEQLEAFLSPEAKAWAMFLSAEYERAGKIVAPVFERIFQTPFPVVPDYVPMSRDVANVDGMAPLDGQTSKGGIEAGFTKSRNKKARAELKRVDAFLSYLAHIDHLSHWVSFVEVTRDMKAIFNDVSVQNAITTKGGQENGTALRTRIKALENKGLDDANSLHTINNIFTRLNTLRAFKGLAFRLSPILKQFSAWANPLLGDVPAWAYLRGHARLMAGKIDVSGMFKSADIQRRIEHGFSPEARIAQKRLGMTGSQMIAIMGKGMRGMTLADAGFTGIGAAISFDFYRSQNEKAGMSKPDAEFEARRQLEILIAETAQPADQVNRSLLESTKNPVVQALLMFISESRKVAAIELMAIRNLATGNSVNKAMDIQRIIVAHGVSTLMTQTMVGLLALLMGDDEDVEREWSVEQWASSFLAGPINGIFILGRGVQMGINRLFKLRTFQNTQPYEKIFDDVYNAGKNLGDLKDDDAEKMRKEYLRLLTATSAAIATVAGPANPVTALDVLSNAAKDVGDVMTRD